MVGLVARGSDGLCEASDQLCGLVESKTGIRDALSVDQRAIGDVLPAAHQVTLQHQGTNAALSAAQLVDHASDNLDLHQRILLAVAVTAVDHDDFRQAGAFESLKGLGDCGREVVGSGLAAASQDEVTIGVATGFEDRWCAFLRQGRKEVPLSGREDGIHRYLNVPIGSVFDPNRHRQARRQFAVDEILAARERHLFPSLTKEGAPAILETCGNPYGHIVLRGGSETGPNYVAPAVDEALQLLEGAGLPKIVMIDCSHGNSEKDPLKQVEVVAGVIDQLRGGQRGIRALMLESHLVAGRQEVTDRPLVYGQSVTDACLGFDQTAELIRRLAEAV